MPSDVICTITRSYPKLVMEENEKKESANIHGKTTIFQSRGKYTVSSSSQSPSPTSGFPPSLCIDDCNNSTMPLRTKLLDPYNKRYTKPKDDVCDREDGDQNRDDVEPLNINSDLKDTKLVVNLNKEFDSDILIDPKTDIETDKWKDENDKAIMADKLYDKNPPEENEDDSCIVDCLYYTLRCCECSIM